MEKEQKFENTLIEDAHFFKALAHPARLKILKYLVESKSCISGDFEMALPLGRTTISQHLDVLKKVGFLKWHQEGAKTFYCLNKEVFSIAKVQAILFLNEIESIENINC